jgi:FkbM family methyltransferase
VATLVYAYSSVEKIERVVSGLPLTELKTVIDVGANNGWFSACLGQRFPSAQYHLVEPNGALHPAIERNCAERRIDYRISGLGISDKDATETMCFQEENSQHSSLIRSAVEAFSLSPRISERVIKVVTLDEYCTQNGIAEIDFLKVDIQGAENLLLDGATEMLTKTRAALFEISFIEEHAVDVFNRLREEFPYHQVAGAVSYGADILFTREKPQNDRLG